MSKALKKKNLRAEGTPLDCRGPEVETVGQIISQYGALFRLGRAGKIDPDLMTKLAYVLTQARQSIETRALEDLQSRLAELSAKVGAQRG